MSLRKIVSTAFIIAGYHTIRPTRINYCMQRTSDFWTCQSLQMKLALSFKFAETAPVCESNSNVDELIGPNSCAIKPTIVQLSCSVKYIGNQVPELQWIKADENIAINSSVCLTSGNIHTCTLTMESELQMEGSSYVCQTRTRKYNCTSGVFRIICEHGNGTCNQVYLF